MDLDIMQSCGSQIFTMEIYKESFKEFQVIFLSFLCEIDNL